LANALTDANEVALWPEAILKAADIFRPLPSRKRISPRGVNEGS